MVCATLAALLAAFCFFPTLDAGLAGADVYLQHASAIAGYDRIPPIAVYARVVAYQRAIEPGWFPLAPIPLAIWLFDPQQRIVKLVELILVALNFATFAILARRIFTSTSAAVLVVVIALAFWQLRLPHDPVLGTSFSMPWLAEPVLVAYAAWFSYRASGKRLWLGITYAAVVAAALTGLAGWVLCALLAALALRGGEHRRAALGIVAALVVTAGASLAFASPFAAFARPSYASDVLGELVSPFPTSFRAFGHLPIDRVAAFWHGNRYVDDRFTKIPSPHLWRWLWLVVAAATTLAALARWPRRRSVGLGTAVAFGCGFWLAPAFVLGPPAVWRGGMPLGQAFDVVYFQTLGLATLTTAGLLFLRRTRLPAALAAPSVCALAVFLLCYGNTRADAVTIARSARYEEPRDLLQRAGAAGFFATLPQGITLAVAPNEPPANELHSDLSDARYALFHYTGRRFDVVSTSALPAPRARNVWILKTSKGSGYFITLSHYAGRRNGSKLTDRSYAFSAIPSLRAALERSIPGLRIRLTDLADGFAIDARRTCGPVPLASALAGQYPTIAWGDGFYLGGPYGHYVDERTFSGQTFMASDASLVLRPTACSSRTITFHTDIASAGAGSFTATAQGVGKRIALWRKPISFTFTVRSKGVPVEVRFATNAPIANLNPVYFRYDADRPQPLRLDLTSSFATQDSPNPAYAGHSRGR